MKHLQTRREVVKTLSLAVAGSTLLSPSVWAQEPKKLGIALVGLGNYSTNQLAPALQHTQLCRLAGIVTGSPDKAKTWMEKYQIPAQNCYTYQNFDDIRNNPDIDIVYVVLPNSMHHEFTIRAARAGKHVICEKPLALHPQQAKEMIAACKQANVRFSVGYRLYFEPHHLEVRRLGVEKVMGAVKMMETSLGFSMADPTSWRLNKQLGGGGAIMDLGVYAIQGARRTIGEDPVRVTAQAYVRDKAVFKGIYETVQFQMEFPGGALSNSTTTYTSYVDRLYATTGYQWFGLQPSFNATGAKGESSEGKIEFQTLPFQQIRQMDDFADCILNNKPSVAAAEEGLKDLQIIEAILKAAQSGQSVEVSY